MNLLILLSLCFVEDPTPEQLAVKMMRNGKGAIMASVNVDKPYCSSVPFALDKNGNPLVFISDLARHTKYIKKNANVSFILNKPDSNGDFFNGSRVTISGKLVKVDRDQKDYFKTYPDAESYADFEDFNFYRLEIEDIFFIGGFGEIHEIELKDYRKEIKK